MHGLHRVDVKVLATDGADVDPYEYVKVFQRWIQEHTVPGVLIDVADYSHMHHGPGVILVGHEKNISMDYTGGEAGLLYHRKQSADGQFQTRLREALRSALRTCAELESEPAFAGKLRFDAGRLLVIANDRLRTPHDDASVALFRNQVFEAFGGTLGADAAFTVRTGDPRDRLVIEVRSVRPLNVSTALNALDAQETG